MPLGALTAPRTRQVRGDWIAWLKRIVARQPGCIGFLRWLALPASLTNSLPTVVGGWVRLQ